MPLNKTRLLEAHRLGVPTETLLDAIRTHHDGEVTFALEMALSRSEDQSEEDFIASLAKAPFTGRMDWIQLRINLAWHSDDPNTLARLVDDPHDRVRFALIRNKNTPAQICAAVAPRLAFHDLVALRYRPDFDEIASLLDFSASEALTQFGATHGLVSVDVALRQIEEGDFRPFDTDTITAEQCQHFAEIALHGVFHLDLARAVIGANNVSTQTIRMLLDRAPTARRSALASATAGSSPVVVTDLDLLHDVVGEWNPLYAHSLFKEFARWPEGVDPEAFILVLAAQKKSLMAHFREHPHHGKSIAAQYDATLERRPDLEAPLAAALVEVLPDYWAAITEYLPHRMAS